MKEIKFDIRKQKDDILIARILDEVIKIRNPEYSIADFAQYLTQALTRNSEEMIEGLEEKLRIVYKNGLIDGKQETNCEEIVVKEALQSLLVDKNNK